MKGLSSGTRVASTPKRFRAKEHGDSRRVPICFKILVAAVRLSTKASCVRAVKAEGTRLRYRLRPFDIMVRHVGTSLRTPNTRHDPPPHPLPVSRLADTHRDGHFNSQNLYSDILPKGDDRCTTAYSCKHIPSLLFLLDHQLQLHLTFQKILNLLRDKLMPTYHAYTQVHLQKSYNQHPMHAATPNSYQTLNTPPEQD
jgi:hypothetical protein